MAMMFTYLLQLFCRIYLMATVGGWLGGMLFAFLIYGTDQTFPYQLITLITMLMLFPVVSCYLALLGIEFNLKGKKDG